MRRSRNVHRATPDRQEQDKSWLSRPVCQSREHYRRYKEEIDGAIIGCLENGDLIHRQQLFDFEKHLADYVGTQYAVGLNSGYHALRFSLLASGIGPGDEVITVAHTFAASVSAIVHCGATPVLVDVGPDYNMAWRWASILFRMIFINNSLRNIPGNETVSVLFSIR